MKHRRRVHGSDRRVSTHQLTQPIEQGAGNLDPDPGPVGLTDVVQGALDLPAQMPGDAIRRLRRLQTSLLGGQPLGELLEARVQALGDQHLVEPRRQLLHGPRSYELVPASAGIDSCRRPAQLERIGRCPLPTPFSPCSPTTTSRSSSRPSTATSTGNSATRPGDTAALSSCRATTPYGGPIDPPRPATSARRSQRSGDAGPWPIGCGHGVREDRPICHGPSQAGSVR